MRTIKRWQLTYWDENGCYDEDFIDPWDINEVSHVMDVIARKDKSLNGDYERLYVIFDDGQWYEVKLEEDKNEQQYDLECLLS